MSVNSRQGDTPMVNEYATVLNDAHGEITEKKSRFMAVLHHVENEDEALEYIGSVRKEFWDARHNCFAFRIGTELPLERANDDGEPSRTAGVPILEVLKVTGLTNVCLVVTRYFGGIKLGTGPLAKAYRDAAISAVNSSQIVTMRLMNDVYIRTDYDTYGKLRHETDKLQLKVLDTVFEEKVILRLALTDDENTKIKSLLNDISRGSADCETKERIWISQESSCLSSE